MIADAMSIKALLLVSLAATAPLCLVSSTQDPASRDPEALSRRLDRLNAELELLQERAAAAAARAEAAEARAEAAERQLGECLDLLEGCHVRERRNCTPSRSLLTHWQWMQRNGHAERAAGLLDRYVTTVGDDPHRLNALAWELMTEEETMGRFDAAALALAERMQRSGRTLGAAMLDTLALARFLNGDLEGAVETQREAIERGGDGDEYRRRLRVYEAAQAAATAPRPAVSARAVALGDG